MTNIYTPKEVVDVIRQSTPNLICVTTKIPFYEYEISISMDDSCGCLKELSRSYIRIHKGNTDVTNDFLEEDEIAICATGPELIRVMKKIEEKNKEEQTQKVIYGPFGRYEHQTVGGLLNALYEHYHLPLNTVEHLRIGDGSITYRDKEVGCFKWFDGLRMPMVRFHSDDFVDYSNRLQGHGMVQLDDGKLKPNFKLSLSNHHSPGLTIHGPLATPELHEFISGTMLTNWMDRPGYKLSKDCGAFFQGGSNEPNGHWIYIEFWNPKGAQAWVDYLNENFRYEKDPYEE